MIGRATAARAPFARRRRATSLTMCGGANAMTTTTTTTRRRELERKRENIRRKFEFLWNLRAVTQTTSATPPLYSHNLNHLDILTPYMVVKLL